MRYCHVAWSWTCTLMLVVDRCASEGERRPMAETLSPPFTPGDAIRRARIDAGLSCEEVAVALEVGYRSVLNWENDIFLPRARTLIAFAELTQAVWLLPTINSASARSIRFARCPGQTLAPAAA